ncbi:unnamed protein product, partial [Symbiodinium microadriaticum]
ARRLAAVKVNTCETSQGGLPFPGLDAVTSALPSPGPQQRALPMLKRPDVVRPRKSSIWQLLLREKRDNLCVSVADRSRLAVMERFMRAVPFWQPLQEKELLPTAESDLEEEMMGKRWRDAALGALLLIGVAVAMAQFFAAVGNCVAERTASEKPVASSRNASLLTVNEDPAETRPMLAEPEKESAGSEGAETLVTCTLTGFYEYELSLGLGKSSVLLARGSHISVRELVWELEPSAGYSGHPGTAPATVLAKVLMSWSMTNNLMLGSAGLVWEAMGLWLVASSGAQELPQAVLAVDVLGYLGRAIQALEMLPHGCVDWPEGAKPRHANDHVCPELVEAFVEQIWNTLTSACLAGPRPPWEDCIFAASVLQLAACAEDDRTRQRGRVLK